MTDRMKHRRDTAATWTSVNPVLADGELAIETDTDRIKFGDGVTAWTSLPYFGTSGAASGCRAYATATQSIANATWTALALQAEKFDTDGYHDNATNNTRLTVPTGKGGTFIMAGQHRFAASTAGFRAIYVRKNGTDVLAGINTGGIQNSGYGASSHQSAVVQLAAGDYIELMAHQTSGGNLSTILDTDSVWLSLGRLGD